MANIYKISPLFDSVTTEPPIPPHEQVNRNFMNAINELGVATLALGAGGLAATVIKTTGVVTGVGITTILVAVSLKNVNSARAREISQTAATTAVATAAATVGIAIGTRGAAVIGATTSAAIFAVGLALDTSLRNAVRMTFQRTVIVATTATFAAALGASALGTAPLEKAALGAAIGSGAAIGALAGIFPVVFGRTKASGAALIGFVGALCISSIAISAALTFESRTIESASAIGAAAAMLLMRNFFKVVEFARKNFAFDE